MTVIVRTQIELDQALAQKIVCIYIESDARIWLTLTDSDSSRIEAWDSSRIEAWDSSRIEAWDSSHVIAWDSSHVIAWGSSHVEARGSSYVEAAGKYVAVHLHSQRVTLSGDGHVVDLTAVDLDDPRQWCEFHGVQINDGIAYLYKAVNDNWSTEYGTDYSPGATPKAVDWNRLANCGGGLHFSAHPVKALNYHPKATRFVKVGVRPEEMVCLGDKIKAEQVVVGCVEVDRYGKELAVKNGMSQKFSEPAESDRLLEKIRQFISMGDFLNAAGTFAQLDALFSAETEPGTVLPPLDWCAARRVMAAQEQEQTT